MKRTHFLTIDQHIALGTMLKDLREALIKVVVTVPCSSETCRWAFRVLRSLDEFCSAMDNQVCSQAPEAIDPRNLAVHVYYGPTHFKRSTSCSADGNESDAFKGWSIETWPTS